MSQDSEPYLGQGKSRTERSDSEDPPPEEKEEERVPDLDVSLGDGKSATNVGAIHGERGIALEPGEALAGRFEIVEKIGEGGMGAVYKVTDTRLGQTRALKVIAPALVNNPNAKQRFFDEIRIAQDLRHPGIVAVYDLGEDPDTGLEFFTMEYVEGDSLDTVLRKQGGRLPVEYAIKLTQRLCRALDYAHRSTVHRDLKPQNIMITSDEEVKILDFGLAKVPSQIDLTRTNVAMGTAYYQAPEQRTDSKNVDQRADVFSLGVMLYECLVGRLPTAMAKPPSRIHSDIPEWLDEVVETCLEFEANDRYDTATALRNALNRPVTPAHPPEREGERTREPPEDRSADAGALPAALPKGSGARRMAPWAALVVIVAALGVWWVYTDMDFTTGDSERVADADGVIAEPIQPVLTGDLSEDDREGERTREPDSPVTPSGPTEEELQRQALERAVAEARDAAMDARIAIGPDERRYAEAEVEAGRDAWDRAEGLDDLEAKQAAYEKSLESYREAKAVTPERKRIAESTPEAVFERVTVAENVEVNGQEGIRIDGSVVVKNLEGERIELAAYVFDDDGDVIAGKDAKYRSARNGQAYVGKEMQVAAREETVADWGLFLPYDQLNLRGEGRHSLKIEPVLWEYSSGRGNELVKGEPKTFTHEVKPSGPVAGEVRTFDGIEFVWIPPGEFMMGSKLSPEEVASRFGREADLFTQEHPRHRVTISEGFWMSKYEITNEQYRRYDSGHDSGSYKGHSLNGAKQPVVRITWNDATNFCQWLSRRGNGTYRLPTEAEWEYACRAGSTTVVPWGDLDATTGRYANVMDRVIKSRFPDVIEEFLERYDAKIVDTDDGYAVSAPVGSYRPNEWGLHDMIGNVYEWCQEWYGSDYYRNSPSTDPPGPGSGKSRLVRGGDWRHLPLGNRSANRSWVAPTGSWDHVGFRVVRSGR